MLVSSFPGRNASEGQAEIGVGQDRPKIYAAGALLTNGARLKEIQAEYVVLEKDGHSIRLTRGESSGPEQMSNLLVADAAPSPVASLPVSHEVLTEHVRPSPVYEGTTLRGYQVQPGSQAESFTRLGLKSGDVITAIDGVVLDDPAHAMDLLRRLATGAVMTATVERDGHEDRIILDGSQLTNAMQNDVTS